LLRDQQRAGTSLGSSTASVLALLDSWPEADEFCEVIRKRAQQPQYSKLIESCNTLSMVVPRPEQQQEKLAAIREIVAELRGRVVSHLAPDLRRAWSRYAQSSPPRSRSRWRRRRAA